MDLSKLSDQDLRALHEKRYADLSNEGLSYVHAQKLATQRPFQTATNQELVAKADPGVMDKLKDPQRWMSLLGQGPHSNKARGAVEGDSPMALPAGALGQVGGMFSKIGTFLGTSAPLRVGTNTALGAAQGATNAALNGEDVVSGGTGGAMRGLVGGVGGEILGKTAGAIGGAAGNIKRTLQFRSASPALQTEGRQVLSEASQELRNLPARETLNELLPKSRVEINPSDLLGKSPKADALLNAHINQATPYGSVPDTMSLSGDKLNEIRQALDSEIPWKDAPYQSLSQAQIKQGKDIQAAAANARGALHGISPEVDSAMTDVSEGIRGAKYLESQGKSPISALSTSNPDKRALLKQLGEASGTNLSEYADKYRAAKEGSQSLPKAGLNTLWQALKGGWKADGMNLKKLLPGGDVE